MDDFWLEAVVMSVNTHVKEQNEQQTKQIQEMTNRIESMKPYQSAMTGMPSPSFLQK